MKHPWMRLVAGGLGIVLVIFFSGQRCWGQGRPDPQAVENFFNAITSNDTNAVFQALAANTNLANARYAMTRLPLHVAAAKGQLEIVKELVKQGAAINAPGDMMESSLANNTALDLAIEYNHPAVCKFLLEAGANPNVLSGFEGSALHYAFSHGREEMAGWLLDHRANPFLPKIIWHNETPFELAITKGDGTWVPRMLEMGRTNYVLPKRQPGAPSFSVSLTDYLNVHGAELMLVATQRREVEAVRALQGAGVPLQAGGAELLAHPEQREVVQTNLVRVIRKGTPPGEPMAPTAMYPAAAAQPERRTGGVTIDQAAASGNLTVLSALTQTTNRLEVRNEQGLTPLQVAVQEGHLGAAALLVDKGADVHVRDAEGNTLLHRIFIQERFSVRDRPSATWLKGLRASPQKATYVKYLTVGQYEQGPEEMLQGTAFLLACGVDVRATNNAGRSVTRLFLARETGRGVSLLLDEGVTNLLVMLRAAGANLNERDTNGDTALHRMCQVPDEYDGRFEALIVAGADVNVTNNAGETPLHEAAKKIWGWPENESGPASFVMMLVKAKANVNARDNNGKTPLQVLEAADTMFKTEAMKVLKEAGATE